jgi:hypothetical protein
MSFVVSDLTTRRSKGVNLTESIAVYVQEAGQWPAIYALLHNVKVFSGLNKRIPGECVTM